MKIALYHNLASGGAKRCAYEHCRWLVRAGHEVVVYEPTTADSTFCDLAEVASETVRVPFEWRELPPGRGWRRAPVGLVNAGLMVSGYRRLTALQAQLAPQIDARGFDLLYVHHDCFEVAPSLLRFVQTPTVYLCAEPSRGIFEAPLVEAPATPIPTPASALWLRAFIGRPWVDAHIRYRILNERANTLAASLVLANSTYSCESILRAHGRRATAFRSGVETEFFCPEDTVARQGFVLSVGGYSAHKGFRFVVRSLGLIPENVRPPLVLVGDRELPGEVAYLHALAQDLGVELTTHMRLSDEQLRELYRQAALFLYAPYLEPLGLTPLEANACGTAVLGVREAGVRETVVDGVTGRLVERDEEQYAWAAQELLGQPEELQRLGRQGREQVCAHWTWQQSAEQVLGVFEKVRRR
jgi:glycosyltransferase involved in cell wall biosynthesis